MRIRGGVWDTGALGTAVGEDVYEANEPRPLGRDVFLEAPDVEYEPMFSSPVLDGEVDRTP
jgi:hypothetical protein